MISNRIDFNDNKSFYLTTYICDLAGENRDAILVIPGGGYGCVCSGREGEPIALSFMIRGMNAFVLNYTTPPTHKYEPLYQASMAMKYIKDNAKDFNINPERVFVVGFSAGGHLAATLGTMWCDKEFNKMYDFKGINKPRGMILCYPVISSEYPHVGSFCSLLGCDESEKEKWKEFSLELKVSDKTCPAFIIHTAEDAVVPVKNAICFANALAENNILFEMHIYPNGPHGMALANNYTMVNVNEYLDKAYSRWIDDVLVWIKRF